MKTVKNPGGAACGQLLETSYAYRDVLSDSFKKSGEAAIKFWGNPLVKCYFRMDIGYLNSFMLIDGVLLAAVTKAWPRRGKFYYGG